jgi:hypothetical protein
MTLPEDENQFRPRSLTEAIKFLLGDFDNEEKPLAPAPEAPIPTKTRTNIDPKLYEVPRKGAEEVKMREWWEEKDNLVASGGWTYPFDKAYDFFPYDYFPPYAERGGIRYPTTTTTTTNTPKKEPVTTKREEILQEAAKLITSDRQEQYGPPEENFKNIADVWNVRFKNKLSEPLTPADVAAAMALLKIVRDMAGYKEDSAVDAAAYIALYAELSEKESKA